MTSKAIHSNPLFTHTSTAPRAARFMLTMLGKLTHGSLTLHLPDGSMRRFGSTHDDAAAAHIHVHDWALFSRVLRGGDIAFAECFMEGQFTTPHLPNVLKLMVANRNTIEKALYGSWWGSLLDRAMHVFRRNSKPQARKNIAAHYDLGNPFYSLWLDKCMTYSAALFATPYQSNPVLDDGALEAAQTAKYQRVLNEITNADVTSGHGATNQALNKAMVQPAGARLLEIGCGWGGFASVAAQQGYTVKGLTLSKEQLAYAQDRLKAQGADQAVQLVLQDYRDEGCKNEGSKNDGSKNGNSKNQDGTQPAQYDGIASIEMFEAVGEAYWPSYFDCVARNLKPGGKACVQSIVIRDDLFERYRKGTDFIQRYIFPGGMLPSPAVFIQAAQAVGLQVVNQHAFGRDYARTLAVWRLRFLKELGAVKAQGYPEKFIRMWEFYLAYCEAGFVGGDIDVVQFTLQKT